MPSVLLGHRVQPRRALVAVAFLCMLFFALTASDAGLGAPYAAVAVICLMQLLRPTLLGWVVVTTFVLAAGGLMSAGLVRDLAMLVTGRAPGALASLREVAYYVGTSLLLLTLAAGLVASRPRRPKAVRQSPSSPRPAARPELVFLRAGRVEDLGGVFELCESVTENRLDRGRLHKRGFSLERMAADMTDGHRVWIAESAGPLVGCAWAQSRDGRVLALAVRPGDQARGIGSRLLEIAVESLSGSDVEQAWMTVEPGTRAVEFLRRQGWTTDGVVVDGELRFELDLTGDHDRSQSAGVADAGVIAEGQAVSDAGDKTVERGAEPRPGRPPGEDREPPP